MEQDLIQLTVIKLCDDFTRYDEVDNYFTTEADTMIDIVCEVDKVFTLYWLSKLHKKPYIARFTANSSSCTATELF